MPVRFSIIHQHFQTWIITIFTAIHFSVNLTPQASLYQPYGHVVTGDLPIISNSKLRDLIAKGPKYREPCKVDWDKNLSLLCEAVDQYALQWAKREIVELSVLSAWKEMLKGQIEERISKLKQNFKQPTEVFAKSGRLTYIINMFSHQQIKLQTIS